MTNLNELSYKELKELATEHALEFKGNISKADLIIMLEDKKEEPVIEEPAEELQETETVIQEASETVNEQPIQEEVVEPVKEEPEEIQTTKGEDLTEEEIINSRSTLLNVALDGKDIELLLNALKEYSNFLKENKRRTGRLVINQEFSDSIDVKVKRADELRFLIKKEVLIIVFKKLATPMYEANNRKPPINANSITYVSKVTGCFFKFLSSVNIKSRKIILYKML